MDRDMLVHPGEMLKEEFLVPHGMTAEALALRLDIDCEDIISLIAGRRDVSGSMSRLLGRAFGMSDDFFANVQVRYALDLAAIEAASDSHLAAQLQKADELARELLSA